MLRDVRANQADVGERLKFVRKAKKVTIEKMAQKLGVSTKTVQNYESGYTPPDYNALCEYVKLGNTSPNYLFGYGKKENAVNQLEDLEKDLDKVEILNKIDVLSKEEVGLLVTILRFMEKNCRFFDIRNKANK